MITVDPEFSFRGRPAMAIALETRDAMENYVNLGLPPGHFLTGIICKDLEMCMDHADSNNLWLIPLIYAWFYNEAPSVCWGDKETMQDWIDSKGKNPPCL